MHRETEAVHPAPWSEWLLLLAFIALAVWCGQRLSQAYVTQTVKINKKTATRSYVGSEWNQIRVFENAPPIEQWERRQAELTTLVQRRISQTLDFGYIVTPLIPPVLNEMDRFDDYNVRVALPAPGAVYQLERGPKKLNFVWTEVPVPGVHYTLEIGRTREFKFFRTFGATKNHLCIQANQKGDYFWRVRADHSRVKSVSELSTFMLLEPPMTAEQRRLKDLAARIKDPTAWLSDLQFCR